MACHGEGTMAWHGMEVEREPWHGKNRLRSHKKESYLHDSISGSRAMIIDAKKSLPKSIFRT